MASTIVHSACRRSPYGPQGALSVLGAGRMWCRAEGLGKHGRDVVLKPLFERHDT